MLCCNSVTSMFAALAVLGSLKVPSSFAITLDFDLAYCTFYSSISFGHAKVKSVPTISSPRNEEPSRERMAWVAVCISLYTICACPRILLVFKATTSRTGPYVEKSM